MLYFIEQCLNGVQLGMLLFLLAAGLTLIFGIMDLVNLAHGSLYMLGAYFAATFASFTESFVLGALLALVATAICGMVLEVIAIRPLYGRPHLDHVLGLAGLIVGKEEEFLARARGELLDRYPLWRDKQIWNSRTGEWVRNPLGLINIVERIALAVSNNR